MVVTCAEVRLESTMCFGILMRMGAERLDAGLGPGGWRERCGCGRGGDRGDRHRLRRGRERGLGGGSRLLRR